MNLKWDYQTTLAIQQKMTAIKARLNGQEADDNRLTQILSQMHSDESEADIQTAIQEIRTGLGGLGWDINEICDMESHKLRVSAEDILAKQMEALASDEAKKGFLCQMYDSIKRADEAVDGTIQDIHVESPDIALASLEELQAIVAEQVTNSVTNLTYEVLNNGLDGVSSVGPLTLETEEDALILAIAQYSASLDGVISYDYSRMPRLLGLCASSQQKICSFCSQISTVDMPEEDDTLVTFLSFVVIFILILALGCIITAIASVMLEPVGAGIMLLGETLFGTGFLAYILELSLLIPACWASLSVAILAVYGVGVGIVKLGELLIAAGSKVKEFYQTLKERTTGDVDAGAGDDIQTEKSYEQTFARAKAKAPAQAT